MNVSVNNKRLCVSNTREIWSRTCKNESTAGSNVIWSRADWQTCRSTNPDDLWKGVKEETWGLYKEMIVHVPVCISR